MNKKIEKIIEELYSQNEEFKKYDKELRSIITKVLESKPNVVIDIQLKKQIINQLLKKEKIMNFTFKPAYVGVGIAIIAMIIVVPFLINQNTTSTGVLTMVGDRAFGDLSNQLSQSESLTDNSKMSVDMVGMGGGGVFVESSIVSMEEPMIYPYHSTQYEYKYIGDEFELIEEEVKVFQRNNGLGSDIYGSNIFSGVDIDAIDLSSFEGLKVDNIQLSDDKDNGYMVNVDFNRGNISINRNYRNWVMTDVSQNMITIDNIPSDEKIINISDSFLKKYKVDLSNYGEPLINKYWENREVFPLESSKQTFAQNIQVIYPLMIDGVVVKEQNGEEYGLNVTVSISENKAIGIYNITSQKYDASMYDAVTDKEKVLSIVKQGGIYGGGYYGSLDKVKTIIGLVGTPELTLMRQYRYDNSVEYELYVPALIFPVTGWESDKTGYTKNIVVPLVKDLITNIDRPVLYKDGIPEPAMDIQFLEIPIEE